MTVTLPVIGDVPIFVVEKVGMFPFPDAANPIAALLFVHAYVVAPTVLVVANVMAVVKLPLQITWFAVSVTWPKGFTVIEIVAWQLLLFVNVITAVPAEIPLTTPEVETVATAILEETQGLVVAPAELPLRVILCPTHTAWGPVIIGIGLITNDLLVLKVPHSLVTERLIV